MTIRATATLIGRLAENPNYQEYNNGSTKVLKLKVITTKVYKVNNDYKERLDTWYIDLFGPLGKSIKQSQTLLKGDLVKFDCELYNNSYKNKDGGMVYTTGFKVIDFDRLARPESNKKGHNNDNLGTSYGYPQDIVEEPSGTSESSELVEDKDMPF